jgi:hypothetical protein
MSNVWKSHTHITIGLTLDEASRLQAVLETSRSDAFDLSMAELSRGLTAVGIYAEFPAEDDTRIYLDDGGVYEEDELDAV